MVIFILLFKAASLVYYLLQTDGGMLEDAAIGMIGGTDGPTAIFATSAPIKIPASLLAIAALAVSLVGLHKTK